METINNCPDPQIRQRVLPIKFVILREEDSEIPVINEHKFLGVIFDKKLTFITHIKYLKNKSTHAQQLLQVVAHTKREADRQTLIKLYRTLLCSQLDYGIFVYRTQPYSPSKLKTGFKSI